MPPSLGAQNLRRGAAEESLDVAGRRAGRRTHTLHAIGIREINPDNPDNSGRALQPCGAHRLSQRRQHVHAWLRRPMEGYRVCQSGRSGMSGLVSRSLPGAAYMSSSPRTARRVAHPSLRLILLGDNVRVVAADGLCQLLEGGWIEDRASPWLPSRRAPVETSVAVRRT